MSTKCKKSRFDLAQVTLILGRIKREGVRTEKDYYKCKSCGWWHLTSMTKEKFEHKKVQYKNFLIKMKEKENWNNKLTK